MKFKSLILLLVALVFGSLNVHAQNPYKEFGIEVKPLTLSNGKYNEFFTNDSLVRIGSIILDTRNNRISSFVVTDTSYSEATLEPEVSSRFLSPDPMGAKYPNLSPYNYVANNPLNAIDPDGRLIIFINGQHNNNAGLYYWRSSGFDLRVMNHLNDHNAIYRDGAMGGWHNTLNKSANFNNVHPSNRYNAGYEQALSDFDYITAKLSPEETIKIITHSMGSVYGKGYVAALKKLIGQSSDPAIRKLKISLVADFDPYQAGSSYGSAHPDIFTQQFWHNGGLFGIADQVQDGVDENNEDETQKSHALKSFLKNVQDLREGTYVWNEKKEQWVCTNCQE